MVVEFYTEWQINKHLVRVIIFSTSKIRVIISGLHEHSELIHCCIECKVCVFVFADVLPHERDSFLGEGIDYWLKSLDIRVS